ncbi:MAG: phosphoribosylaminoimidazolesuccinocarboxamide synthase [Chthonomonadales bacterium]
MDPIVLSTHIPNLPKRGSGKVRDIYDLGANLLIVTTDRISAFDVVMPNGIPHKGRVLTHLSRFWFLQLRPYVANHYITFDTHYICAQLAEVGVDVTPELRTQLHGRSMLVLKAEVFPIECVVRGYLSGSLWAEYRQAGGEQHAVTLHGIELPGGMRESERLPEPLFTPATKEATGHDINIGMAEMRRIVGSEDAETLRHLSLEIYRLAAARALRNGIIIADTKFEFGVHNGGIILIDEVLTPDSSRFWDAATYTPGRPQPSFDKQYLRDWLVQSGWNKEPPAPTLPKEVVERTSAKYLEAYRRITGEALPMN